MKRILQMADNRGFPLKHHGYDVESHPLQRNSRAPREFLGAVHHPPLLFPIDIALRGAELRRGPGFDLDHHQCIVLARNQV